MTYRKMSTRTTLAIASLVAATGLLVSSACTSNRTAGETLLSEAKLSKEEPMPLAEKRPTVLHANDANFEEEVLRAKVPVLVDFYADWCGPCQRLAPVLDELAAETPHAKVVKVNVEHSPELAAEYGVQSIPALKVFKNGKITDQAVGLASKNQLRAMLTR